MFPSCEMYAKKFQNQKQRGKEIKRVRKTKKLRQKGGKQNKGRRQAHGKFSQGPRKRKNEAK